MFCSEKITVPPRRAIQRLAEPHLQIAFRRLHRCGPRPTAMCFAEMLDAHEFDPEALDFILTWCRFDPAVVAAIGGEFPRPPLVLVPPT
jgi:hypothetical protein